MNKKNRKLRQKELKNSQNRILKGIVRYLCLYGGQFSWILAIFLMADFLPWLLMQFHIELNDSLNQIDIGLEMNWKVSATSRSKIERNGNRFDLTALIQRLSESIYKLYFSVYKRYVKLYFSPFRSSRPSPVKRCWCCPARRWSCSSGPSGCGRRWRGSTSCCRPAPSWGSRSRWRRPARRGRSKRVLLMANKITAPACILVYTNILTAMWQSFFGTKLDRGFENE